MKSSVDKYVEYHRLNAINWEIDTHLDAAVYFADKWSLDIEQRCWLAFLTAICETTPTSIYLFRNFPDMLTTDARAFDSFTKANKSAMAFQYDVRWILYSIYDVVRGYKRIIGNSSQIDKLRGLTGGGSARERWRNFIRNFTVTKFGTYTFMLYTELLHHLCDIRTDAILDPRTNHSVRSGLIHAGGYEDFMKCTTKHGAKPTEIETQLLNATLGEIRDKISALDIERRHKTTWAIETTLCTYNKTLHGRRYIGFYKERQRKEICRLNDYTQTVGEAFDWGEVWEYHNNWGNWGNSYNI